MSAPNLPIINLNGHKLTTVQAAAIINVILDHILRTKTQAKKQRDIGRPLSADYIDAHTGTLAELLEMCDAHYDEKTTGSKK